MKLTLISHRLCPYVQRAAIALQEKGVPFERVDIDLAHKPDWFLALSPTGKTPLLLVEGQPIFESAVICEYLEDTALPALHPTDALQRAQHRGWIEFASVTLNDIGNLYAAADEAGLQRAGQALRTRFERLESVLGEGSFFAGSAFSLVDAAFAPAFRYFEALTEVADLQLFAGLPKLQAWRQALADRPSVQQAVDVGYPRELRAFVSQKGSALARRMQLAA
ncbi:glutathione S-transferase family protein [Leeia aquatica]|uniref:glutathione transferase n=1 Tax=Leeia aquatica TaxID=2725557 RepID=A0A847RYP0_9NEIS|nr:glutathione S-transferase family protein [Leeia aquatica]NLR76260.1 glutathione S-transferase family protein [Leeia aquatica]